MITKSLFSTMGISAQGLSVQRTKMNTIAENIANAETTKTENGEAYRRKIVQIEAGDKERKFSDYFKPNRIDMTETNSVHMTDKKFNYIDEKPRIGVHIAEIAKDPSAFKMIYDPAHPDANEKGYVAMPNVNIVQEMVEMISASRSYEANVTALNSSKDMIRNALKI
ncbi:MAG TPA: flagellar basal body rod protein FlgC [Candidatus Cloacimonadota bacterium]|nr:flagellar basal body rod protein FlgC [Candidatus Cloacimonadota bacterium]HPM00671.1 flagellar basal body rod protein FlgC [Candidatus Cloacimonadota bacterium]